MDMDVQHRLLFIGGRNKLLPSWCWQREGSPDVPIGDGVDTNIYDPKTGLLFTATREGTLHVSMKTLPANSAW